MKLTDTTYWLECKYDFKSEVTNRFCVELESVAHSKAFLFVYGFPYGRKTYLHSFQKTELEQLIQQTSYDRYKGRFLTYRQIRIGDQPTNLGITPPLSLLHKVGQPFGKAIHELIKSEQRLLTKVA